MNDEKFSIPVLLIAVALTLFVGILVLNFNTGEKKIEQSVERLYAVADPAFARAMGVLLGPAMLQEWQQRPLAEKVLDHAASLIGAQL